MDNIAGYIYILTNPSFPEYVKIGWATDVDDRLKQLNRSECTPFAFRTYATYATPTKLSDMKLHDMIDGLNPELRSIDHVNGKTRVREFYAMSAEDAYLMLEAIAEIHGTTNLLVKVKPNSEETEEAKTAEEIQATRAKSFSFDMVNIPVGSEVEFCKNKYDNSGQKFKVVDNKHILYNGEPTALSNVATELLHRTSLVQGPKYFKYNGELLTDMRVRLGV